MEGSKIRARVICNPASGGGCEPDDIRRELEEIDAEWINTGGAGDALTCFAACSSSGAFFLSG